VPHQHARCQLGDLRLVTRDSPGEDVDLDTPLRQAPRDLDNVDIETACVASARLLKR
jgi:hypothetical protein